MSYMKLLKPTIIALKYLVMNKNRDEFKD